MEENNNPIPINNEEIKPKGKFTLPKISSKLMIIVGLVILMILFVTGVILYVIVSKSRTQITAPQPINEATPSPTPIITNPTKSKFASDAGLVKIRDDINTLNSQVDSIDLFEPQLSPPAVDIGIVINNR